MWGTLAITAVGDRQKALSGSQPSPLSEVQVSEGLHLSKQGGHAPVDGPTSTGIWVTKIGISGFLRMRTGSWKKMGVDLGEAGGGKER